MPDMRKYRIVVRLLIETTGTQEQQETRVLQLLKSAFVNVLSVDVRSEPTD